MPSKIEEQGSIRILLVDDEKDQAELFKLYIEHVDKSIHVDYTSSPSEALKIVKKGGIDCVVSDYVMPEVDGIQLLSEIKKVRDIPVILYTGRGSEAVEEKALSSGVDEYVTKEKEITHYKALADWIRQLVAKYRSITK